MSIHLIITTAHIQDEQRIIDYKDSFKSVIRYKERFKTINLVETVSNSKLDYLEDLNFKVHYSNLENSFPYKGTNWLNHMQNFVLNNFDINDILVFMTGRYKLYNENIFHLIDEFIINDKYEFIAKSDGDIYVGRGVHTFFLAFTKKEFLKFTEWYIELEIKNPCIEWDLKDYMNNNEKCHIISKDIIMGVETNIDSNKLKTIC